jgi:hypothetical protein
MVPPRLWRPRPAGALGVAHQALWDWGGGLLWLLTAARHGGLRCRPGGHAAMRHRLRALPGDDSPCRCSRPMPPQVAA